MTETKEKPLLPGPEQRLQVKHEQLNNTTIYNNCQDENLILDAAIHLLRAGFSVIPANAHNKRTPLESWWPYQKKPMGAEEAVRHFCNGNRLAVICGEVSGNLECIDFDRPDLFSPFMETLTEIDSDLAASLVQRQTPSGGYHLIYRCRGSVKGNQKLATSADEDTWIETRGEGGYFLTSPSEGYVVLKHSLLEVPVLTSEQRALLISIARSFSEKKEPPPPERRSFETGGRPGDDYNKRADDAVWRDLLEKEGWTFTGRVGSGGEYLIRPGKTDGNSATLKNGCLYVFSSNAGIPLGPHSAFSVYAHLRHNGDFSEAARELGRQGYGTGVAAVSEAPEWGDPISLPETLSPVDSFDLELMPVTVRPWVEDICDRIQCAPDYVGVTAVTALATVLGRKIGMRPQARTDWTETPNQWGLLIGRPGVLKSPAMEAALHPLKRLSAEAARIYSEEIHDFKTAKTFATLSLEEQKKKARGAIKDGNEKEALRILDVREPEEPIKCRYVVNDTSAAALGELHRQNPNGLLVYRDEMVSLLRSLDLEENSGARGFYLTGWNGNSAYTVDRIGRGFDLYIPAVCLSLLGSTQPARISGYIKQAIDGSIGDDGLIQRFGLLVWPDNSDWKDVDRWPDNKAKQAAFEVFSYLDKLEAHHVGAQQDTDINEEPDGVPFLRFDPEALEIFREWRERLEKRLRTDDLHPAFESHLSKYRSLVPGLALLFHLSSYGTGSVSKVPLMQALSWSTYLESHANRAYRSVTMPDVKVSKAILRKIKTGALRSPFSSREVWRPGWSGLSDSKVVAEGLRLLVDYNWLDTKMVTTAGRNKTIYTVNPKALPR